MTKSTLTLTQSGLLAVLLEQQHRKVIQLARRRAHREQLRAAFWIPSLGHFAPSHHERASTIQPSPRREPSHARLESIAMSPQVHIYSVRQKIQHEPSLRTGNLISQRRRLLFIRIQQLIAVAMPGFLVLLWFSGSRYHAPQPSYPYYDTEKPVPPWSEPAALEGNYTREGDYK